MGGVRIIGRGLIAGLQVYMCAYEALALKLILESISSRDSKLELADASTLSLAAQVH